MSDQTLPTMVAASALMMFSVPAVADEGPQHCLDEFHCDLLQGYIEVSAERLPVSSIGQSVVALDEARLAGARLDSGLVTVPGLTLFRRADSLTAHPTTQGLSLRGVGANAAGRVLVTLDGVPLNDPFGGWIYFSTLPAESLERVTVFRGGSAGAFGAQALSGAIALQSRHVDETNVRTQLSFGRFHTVEAKLFADFVGENGTVSVDIGYFDSDGPYLLARSDRGAIDVPAASEAYFANIRAVRDLSDAITVKAGLRVYGEERTNGLSLAVNETDAVDLSLALVRNASTGLNWEVIGYYRTRDFENTFASARDERTSERAVLDQFDVPGTGAGGLARIQYKGFEFGVDTRRLSGSTNEEFRNLGGGFTRVRRAGGDQWILGTFAGYDGKVGKLSYGLSARLDRWRSFSGERVENDLTDGNETRREDISNRADWIASGRAGLSYEITENWDIRTAAFRSWRLPTINEFYRPFRVVNDITEANPYLTVEKLHGLEFGLDYSNADGVEVSATLFRNWLRDGVGNVTVGFGPGFFPLGGFVPAGGTLRQRTNIDRQKTDGFEIDGKFALTDEWQFYISYLYARSRITRFDSQPNLIGNRPVQTPKHSAVSTFEYRGDSMDGAIRLRYQSGQFDDDLNERRLQSVVTVDFNLLKNISERWRVFTNIENLFDRKIVSAVSGTGLETIARRFNWRVGLEAKF